VAKLANAQRTANSAAVSFEKMLEEPSLTSKNATASASHIQPSRQPRSGVSLEQ
jgi:hypothetical protein